MLVIVAVTVTDSTPATAGTAVEAALLMLTEVAPLDAVDVPESVESDTCEMVNIPLQGTLQHLDAKDELPRYVEATVPLPPLSCVHPCSASVETTIESSIVEVFETVVLQTM